MKFNLTLNPIPDFDAFKVAVGAALGLEAGVEYVTSLAIFSDEDGETVCVLAHALILLGSSGRQ